MIQEGLKLSEQYLGKIQLFLLIVFIIILIIVLILIWNKERYKLRLKLNIVITFAAILIIMYHIISGYVYSKGIIQKDFADLYSAYQYNGFVYSFTNTLFDIGMKKPGLYTKEKINEINNRLFNESLQSDSNKHDSPNIIVVQLESFMDPLWIKENEYSTDPIPNFRKLSEEYSSGFLKVPAIGGGTAKTEFEVITGLSIDFFSPGEIPYNTILKNNTIESMNYILKEYGYKSHAIHNHDGTFYDRNKVYSNLGFDTFTSIEYMTEYEKTFTGWSKDSILTKEIEMKLDSTEESDIIYAVSVQGHGAYPTEDVLENKNIEISVVKDGYNKYSWEYYVNQLNEMDSFVKDLIQMIEDKGEDSVVVLFGDHLPGLSIENEDLTTNDIFLSPYVIWDNIGLDKENKDINSYQLSSEIFSKLNIDNNKISKFHSLYSRSKNYMEMFELLQYDILYGQKYIYNQTSKYKKSNLKMGTEEIAITDVISKEGNLNIIGKNFTEFSKICINDKMYDCKYVDDKNIIVDIKSIQKGDKIQVKQVGRNNIILSETKVYTVE